jgi:hypothetical protein
MTGSSSSRRPDDERVAGPVDHDVVDGVVESPKR